MMRLLLAVVAVIFVLGAAGCGKKAALGEPCKRHSQCESGICGSDLKCHTMESERKLRKETAKKRRR